MCGVCGDVVYGVLCYMVYGVFRAVCVGLCVVCVGILCVGVVLCVLYGVGVLCVT